MAGIIIGIVLAVIIIIILLMLSVVQLDRLAAV